MCETTSCSMLVCMHVRGDVMIDGMHVRSVMMWSNTCIHDYDHNHHHQHHARLQEDEMKETPGSSSTGGMIHTQKNANANDPPPKARMHDGGEGGKWMMSLTWLSI